MAGFMRLQVWREGMAHPNENAGALDDRGPMPESEADMELYTPSGLKRWWGCYSAPGYMDRTDTLGPYDSAKEAALETYGMFGNPSYDDTPHESEDETEVRELLASLGVVYRFPGKVVE